MRSVLSLMAALLLCLGVASAQAATPSVAPSSSSASPSGITTLEPAVRALEKQYFEHTYEADLIDTRIERLEKLVFGEARTGSDSDRISRLQSIAAESATAAPIETGAGGSPSGSANAGSSNNYSQQSSSGSSADSTTQANSDSDDEDTPNSSGYPRVTALESEILGTTFANEPVHRRIEQLETKAFGKPSNTQDLSDRVDKLEQYALTYLHKTPYGVNPEMNDDPYNQVINARSPEYNFSHTTAQAPAAPPAPVGPPPKPSASDPMLTKVSWMETMVYGHTFDDEHLLDRLQRLEVSVFPNHPPEDKYKLMDQTDDLMNAVAMLPPGRKANGSGTGADGSGSSVDIASGENNNSGDSVQKHPLFRSISQALSAAGKLAAESGGSGTSGAAYGNGQGYGVPGFMGMAPGFSF